MVGQRTDRHPGGPRVAGDDGLTRRSVVLGLGGAAAVGVAAVAGVRLLDGSPDDEDVERATPAEPDDAIAFIGTTYRETYPEDADRDALEEAFPEWIDLDAAQARAALPSLRPRIVEDFAVGDVVTVDGWKLARTEARAAALISLL